MKTTIQILTCKLITNVCKLFKKNGTVYPGSVALKMNGKVLENVKYPKYVIGVTGSSGKGSTTSMLAHILKDNGLNVVWNSSGSNVLNGTATLILNNTNAFTHKLKADVLLLEMDESYIKKTFTKSTLTHLVITNITRDQPARNGEPEIILNKILSSIDENTEVIINADDPFVNRFTFLHKGPVCTYGINKTLYDLKKPISNNVDAAYCPICHKKLKYTSYHYGHLGVYSCTTKDFVRKTDFTGDNLNLESKEMIINGNKVKLNKDVFFAAYYTLAAYSAASEIGLTDKQIMHALNENTLESKRLKTLKLDNREVDMLESKNENNLSYVQSLNYINNHKGPKTIIMGFDNVSRRYKYNDISWLYDVDFKILNTDEIDKIFCIGRFRYDVEARLLLEGVPKEKIFMVDNINLIIKYLRENSDGTIFTMVCFDMTEVLKKLFKEANTYEG